MPTPESPTGPELPAKVAAELCELRARARDQEQRLCEQEQEIDILSKATAWFTGRNPSISR